MWWQTRKRDQDIDRELQSDLELEEEEQREQGIAPEEARHAALRAFECTLEYVDDVGKVVGVNGVSARPSLEFLERLAEVVEDLLVDELDRAVRCQNRNESGNPVDDVVESELALHGALVAASLLTPKIASVRPDVRSRETSRKCAECRLKRSEILTHSPLPNPRSFCGGKLA